MRKWDSDSFSLTQPEGREKEGGGGEVGGQGKSEQVRKRERKKERRERDSSTLQHDVVHVQNCFCDIGTNIPELICSRAFAVSCGHPHTLSRHKHDTLLEFAFKEARVKRTKWPVPRLQAPGAPVLG